MCSSSGVAFSIPPAAPRAAAVSRGRDDRRGRPARNRRWGGAGRQAGAAAGRRGPRRAEKQEAPCLWALEVCTACAPRRGFPGSGRVGSGSSSMRGGPPRWRAEAQRHATARAATRTSARPAICSVEVARVDRKWGFEAPLLGLLPRSRGSRLRFLAFRDVPSSELPRRFPSPAASAPAFVIIITRKLCRGEQSSPTYADTLRREYEQRPSRGYAVARHARHALRSSVLVHDAQTCTVRYCIDDLLSL